MTLKTDFRYLLRQTDMVLYPLQWNYSAHVWVDTNHVARVNVTGPMQFLVRIQWRNNESERWHTTEEFQGSMSVTHVAKRDGAQMRVGVLPLFNIDSGGGTVSGFAIRIGGVSQ